MQGSVYHVATCGHKPHAKTQPHLLVRCPAPVSSFAAQTDAPLLVLLHGFTGTCETWDPVTSRLPKGLDTLALPLPGHRGGEPPQKDFLSSCDVLLEKLIAHSHRPLHLVGYSLGARLALGMTLRNRALFSTMTLVGSHFGLETHEARTARILSDSTWCSLLREKGIASFARAWEAQPIISQAPMGGRANVQLWQKSRLTHDAETLARSLETTGLGVMPNFWPTLVKIDLPVTLIVGGRDAKFMAIAERAYGLLPNAEWDIVPECGHNVVRDAPQDLAALMVQSIQSSA